MDIGLGTINSARAVRMSNRSEAGKEDVFFWWSGAHVIPMGLREVQARGVTDMESSLYGSSLGEQGSSQTTGQLQLVHEDWGEKKNVSKRPEKKQQTSRRENRERILTEPKRSMNIKQKVTQKVKTMQKSIGYPWKLSLNIAIHLLVNGDYKKLLQDTGLQKVDLKHGIDLSNVELKGTGLLPSWIRPWALRQE